jgi:hypothetical protein
MSEARGLPRFSVKKTSVERLRFTSRSTNIDLLLIYATEKKSAGGSRELV